MSRRFFNLASWLVASILLFFTARRWLFVLFALVPHRPVLLDHGSGPPLVLLLVPVRNEADSLPGLTQALAHLAYPAEKLTVVFVDDGSTDGSGDMLQRVTAGRRRWQVLSLPKNVGKAAALNAALARFPQGDIVAIYDADERPRPETLSRLVAPFANPKVGGVSGRRAVSNALASPAASYTSFEGLVHQQISMRAKDRLALGPALLGSNCAYRRLALAQAGNFRPGALLEDTELTLTLARGGWQLRFTPQAVSFHRAPESVTGYWKQHTRWARGFNEAARRQVNLLWRNQTLSLPVRLELLAFSLGYLDRLALLAGLVLAAAGSRLAGAAVAISLVTPLLQIAAALKIDGQPAAMWRRLGWLPLFFVVDMAMAVAGLWHTMRRSPRIWEERRARQ